MRRTTWPLLACLSLVFATQAPATAETTLPSGPSFRLETEIYENDANEPSSRHKILFDSGVVYDLEENGGRIQTVFDVARNRVILLDTKTEVQTEIATQILVDAAAQLRLAARQSHKTELFGLTATVVEDEDQSYEIRFGGCHYETTTQAAKRPELATAFHELTLWAQRLNVLRRRGPPPFGRMTLGKHLAEEGRIPLDLVLTLQVEDEQQRFRAHHLVIEKLSDLDRRTIRGVGDRLTKYRKVDLAEFPDEV